MKKTVVIIFISILQLNAQTDSLRPSNSIYKNFRPFSTPRTNYRPGTVYRIDKNNVEYIVQDISSIKSLESSEGNVTGRMVFSKDEILESLNIEFNLNYITAEVELKNAVREFTEQSNMDYILWENDVAEDLVVDAKSKYYIVRETVSSKEITYRFDKVSADSIIAGKGNLKEKQAAGDQIIDFPYSVTKKFKEPKRLLYLIQEITVDPYNEEK